jgi:hypothetical protein
VSKRRRVLFNVAEYAVELGALGANPLPGFKWKAPGVSVAVDRRSVVNPVQARTLLRAVRDTERVRKQNLSIPAKGWDELYLEEATPHAGSDWTNDGRQRDQRQLKNRARGEGRVVPSPPELTAHIHDHVAEFGTDEEGRLFRGERAAELPKLTYMRTWRAARRRAFTPEAAASSLAATPYALRHASVSTWLSGGVPATQVAEWAGHSVEVLLKVYAKTIDGQEEAARQRVMDALGHRGSAQ